MKIRNAAFMFIVSFVFSTIHASQPLNDKQLVFIVNEYKNKIILNMTGQNAIVMEAYGGKERLYELPDSIKIRTENGNYHFGINKELNKVKDAAKYYPSFQATITILNTGSFISFDYSTDIKQTPAGSAPASNFAQTVHNASNKVEPIMKYIYANHQQFPKTARQLNLIQYSVYKGSSSSKDAVPTIMLESEIYKEASAAVQKNASDNEFIKSIIEAINRTYHRMIAQWQRGSVQFNPIQGVVITPEYLSSLLDKPM